MQKGGLKEIGETLSKAAGGAEIIRGRRREGKASNRCRKEKRPGPSSHNEGRGGKPSSISGAGKKKTRQSH